MSIKLVPASPLEELQKLAGQPENPTSAMPAITTKPTAENIRIPTGYQNFTLSPWALIIAAIVENRRYMNAAVLPKVLYVSNTLLEQLPKDMQCCRIEEEFNGYSIPFMQLNGEKVYIPIVSAEKELGVIIPKCAVWCSN